MTGSPLLPLAAKTLDVYERYADAFDQSRNKSLFERRWLNTFLRDVPPTGHILDVGCGSGVPIAAYLHAQGRHITGLDGAAAMVDLARNRFPGLTWQQMDMRTFDLGQQYDGVIAWNSFFHLTRPEQRAVLPRLVNHLTAGGPLMLTIGTGDGEVTGTVAGQTVYHASLSQADYTAILDACGCDVVDFVLEDPSCNHHSILFARKRSGEHIMD